MMSALKNDRFLKALLRQPVDQTPVWMMRQAGRYLPEYRATRKVAGDFMSLCKNAELACEVTMQPLERYPLDAAILFSDILTIPDAMDCGLYFEAGEGPRFERPVRTRADIDALPVPSMADALDYVMNAVTTIRRELNGRVPLIGFSGSPWTLATYMIEGGSSKDYAMTRNWLWGYRKETDNLIELLIEAISQSLILQAQNGANVLMIFDSWASAVPSELRTDIIEKPVQAIIEKVRNAGITAPFICFPRGISADLIRFADNVDCQALALDQGVSPTFAARHIRKDMTLQGNLDPQALIYGGDTMKQAIDHILEAFHDRAHIFNLGHGITPSTPVENVHELINYIRD